MTCKIPPNRRALLAGLGVAALAPAAAAQTRGGEKSWPMGKAFPFLEAYLRLSPAERDRFAPVYAYTDEGAPPLRAWLVEGGRRTELPLGRGGRVGRLPGLATLRDRSARVVFNRPTDDTITFNLAVEAPTLRAERVSAAEVRAALEQCDHAVRRIAGLARFAAPRMEAAVFSGVGSGEVLLAGGRRAALPIRAGEALFVPARWPGAEELRFARAPVDVALGPAPKPGRS